MSVDTGRRMTSLVADRRRAVTGAARRIPTGVVEPPATAVLSLIAAGAVAVVALWWGNTPQIHGPGDWLTNAGRITGLLAGYAVAVLIALMARIPPLERGIGVDRLARWHGRGGRYTVGLVVAHGLLIAWGYSVTAHTDLVSQTGSLLTSYPDVLMATVGALLLVGVGVVSARAVRQRMRYETWYYLHFYTYLAAALAFSHQFATGAEFVTNRAARVAWSAMYAAVAAAIVWYRFVTPLRRAFRHRLRVVDVHEEGPEVISVLISGVRLDDLAVQAGHFFRWRFLTRELWWAANPYSLSAPPRGDRLRITIKCVGDHSDALRRLRPGTRVIAEGPYGALTAERRRHRKVLLIAGGIGITPLRALFETIPAASGDLTLLYRAGSKTDIVFRDELNRIAVDRGARLHIVTGRRAELRSDPLSAEALTETVPDLRAHDVFVCGSSSMTAAVAHALRTAKVPHRQIHHESFGLWPTATQERRGPALALLGVLSTVAGLVLLLSLKIGGASSLAIPPAAVGDHPGRPSASTHAEQPAGAAGSRTQVVVGAAAATKYGPVQLEITRTNGKLTQITMLDYPTRDAHETKVNTDATVALTREALAANSADIDMISGATFTSQGYISSLQSALDMAK